MRGSLNIIAASGGSIRPSAGVVADTEQTASVLPIPVPLGSAAVTVAGGASPTNAVITLANAVPGVGASASIFDDEFSTAPWQAHQTWQAGDLWAYAITNATSGATDGNDTWWANPLVTTQAATVYPSPSGGALSLGLMTTPAGIGISQAFIGTIINNQNSSGARLFGYHEFRVKAPNTPGFEFQWDIEDYLLSASWNVEIDFRIWVDTGGTKHARVQLSGSTISVIVVYDTTSLDITQYHVYGINWQSDHITVYVDGKMVGQVVNPGGPWLTNACFAYMLTSAATYQVGDGVPTAASLPAFAQVDYYRLFSDIPTTSGAVLVHAYNPGGSANTITDSVGQTWVRHPDARVGSPPLLTAISYNTKPMPAGGTITVGFTNASTNTLGTAAAWYVPYVNGASFGSLANVGSTGGTPDAPTITTSVSGVAVTVFVTLPATGAALDTGVVQVQYRTTGSTSWTATPAPPPYITPLNGAIQDAYGNTWTIVAESSGQVQTVMCNGVFANGWNAVLMLLLNGTLYHINTSNEWWSYTPTGPVTPANVSWSDAGATSPLLTLGITALLPQLQTSQQYDITTYVSNAAGAGTLSAVSQVTIAGNASSVGPGVSSGFLTADFTSQTGKTIYPQLFGLSTGGLANSSDPSWLSISGRVGNWADFATYPALRATVRALNTPCIRINSNWGNSDTFNGPYMLDNLLNNIASGFPSTTTWIYGISTPTKTYQAFFNFAQAFCQYWRDHAPSGYKLQYLECMNEDLTQLSTATYNSCFSGMVAGAQSVDPTIKGVGPTTSYQGEGGFLTALIPSQTADTLGATDWHAYQYLAGPNPAPSDFQVMTSAAAPNDISQTFANLAGYVGATYAANIPGFMGEWNVEAGANFEPRTQTNIGAGFMVSALLKGAAQSISPAWAGVWDPYFDGTYSLITGDGVNFPPASAQYGVLQNATRCMPGAMVNVSTGNGNVLAWASKSGSGFGLAIVNADISPQTGNIALSHWPVNTSGNATLTMWQVDANNDPLGVTTHPTASGGMLSNVTLTSMSVTIISYP